MKFKELKIESESNWFKRFLRSKQTKKTIIFTSIGAVVGFLLFFFTDGRQQDVMKFNDILNNLLIGGFFGGFIANSPCARNKC